MTDGPEPTCEVSAEVDAIANSGMTRIAATATTMTTTTRAIRRPSG
ncbi:MAG: hypothetical protein ACR2P2_20705 [Nakamurella sp.]